MKYFSKRRLWFGTLFVVGIFTVVLIIRYVSDIITNVAKNEKEKVQFWADAVKHRADLVNYSEVFFENISNEERKRVAIWAEAYKKVYSSNLDEDVTFYLKIISDDTNIPVIVTDGHYNIIGKSNTNDIPDSIHILTGKLLDEYTQFSPLVYADYGYKYFFFYKESKIYSDLREMFQNQLQAFFTDIVDDPGLSTPVIITDSTQSHIILSGNINENMKDSTVAKKLLESLKKANPPIEVDIKSIGKTFIFYEDSYLLSQLRYYPFILIGLAFVFIIIGYVMIYITRRNEQNQLWVSMSKETAHQLGTPISSLVAWVEYMKLMQLDSEITTEINKDISRLEIIAQRFSKIGSEPELKPENIISILHQSIVYLQKRTSQKVHYVVNIPKIEIIIPLNAYLFEWVVENICKNAVDAMGGTGTLTLDFSEDSNHIFIDISDTGKGMTKAVAKAIFNTGFTTKQRGWGVGLSISRRIIRNYHRGNLIVKNTVVGKGSTFRIALHKDGHQHTMRRIKQILFLKKQN